MARTVHPGCLGHDTVCLCLWAVLWVGEKREKQNRLNKNRINTWLYVFFVSFFFFSSKKWIYQEHWQWKLSASGGRKCPDCRGLCIDQMLRDWCIVSGWVQFLFFWKVIKQSKKMFKDVFSNLLSWFTRSLFLITTPLLHLMGIVLILFRPWLLVYCIA